jgi:Na+-translocating ferredoxin:NAD+ oxidoreductase RNF subunit RnfB
MIQRVLIGIIVLGVLGALLSFLLSIAAKKFAIKDNVSCEKVVALLPGLNCGACGYPGCSELANEIVKGKAKVELCRITKEDARKEIMKIIKNANF